MTSVAHVYTGAEGPFQWSRGRGWLEPPPPPYTAGAEEEYRLLWKRVTMNPPLSYSERRGKGGGRSRLNDPQLHALLQTKF